MEIEKRCKWCGKTFIAHTLNTQYCSHTCNSRAYKDKKRKEKIAQVQQADLSEHLEPISAKRKEFLSPREAAALLGVSRSTLYRYLGDGLLPVLQLPGRTIIRREDIESLFDKAPLYQKKVDRAQAGFWTIADITEKYGISEKKVRAMLSKIEPEKVFRSNRCYYLSSQIEEYFSSLHIGEDPVPGGHVTVAEAMEYYGMSKHAVLCFVKRHNIPRLRKGRIVYYSRPHIESIKYKGNENAPDPDFYSLAEIYRVYGLTKDQVRWHLKKQQIAVKRIGKQLLINRKDFNGLLQELTDGDWQLPQRSPDTDSTANTEMADTSSDDTLSTEEVMKTLGLGKKQVWNLMNNHSVPRKQVDGINRYDKSAVLQILASRKKTDGISDWMTAAQMEAEYNMTPVARRSFVYRHHIPSKKENGIVLYSKTHVAAARDGEFLDREMT